MSRFFRNFTLVVYSFKYVVIRNQQDSFRNKRNGIVTLSKVALNENIGKITAELTAEREEIQRKEMNLEKMQCNIEQLEVQNIYLRYL